MKCGKLLLVGLFSVATVVAEIPADVSGQTAKTQLGEIKIKSLEELKAMRKLIIESKESRFTLAIKKIINSLGISIETVGDVSGEFIPYVLSICTSLAIYAYLCGNTNALSYTPQAIRERFSARTFTSLDVGIAFAAYLAAHGLFKIIGTVLRENSQRDSSEERVLLSQYDVLLRNLDAEIEKLERATIA